MGTESKRDPRLEVTKRIMKYFARSGQGNCLPIQLDDGRRPVVVAMPDDRISEVANKVKSYGKANVCVAMSDGLVVLGFEGCLSNESIRPIGDVQDVHQDISIGMLISAAETLNKTNSKLAFSISFGDTHGQVPSVRTLISA